MLSDTIISVRSLSKFLPSKGFLAVGAALVFSIVLVFGIYKLTNGNSTTNQPLIPILSTTNDAAVAAIQKSLAEKDSDKDGLKNWEEALWGTDPNNSDTDGDGTPDGEEVGLGRNPTIKGPNDKVSPPVADTGENGSTQNEASTATSRVARATFAQYLQAKQNGGAISQDIQISMYALDRIRSHTIQQAQSSPKITPEVFTPASAAACKLIM